MAYTASITALRHDALVHVIVDDKMYARQFSNNADAAGFYETAKSTALHPTQVNVSTLVSDLDPGHTLKMNDILTERNGKFYLTGYEAAAIPETLLVRMTNLLQEGKSITSMINFWKLLILNPDTHVREDLFKFMDTYDFPITDNGYFIGYRACKQTNKKYSAVTNFVPKEYLMLKAEGLNPADYTAVKDPEGGDLKAVLTEVLQDDKGNFIAPENVLGNLESMFQDQNNGLVEAPEFTDHWSGTTSVRLGGSVSMPRADCDNNPKNACSSGLHIGTPEYVKKFGGSGSAFIACLVNPMNVVAVPSDYSYMKMRVCEYYAYGMVDLTKGVEIRTPYFEIDYKTWEERELEKQLEELVEAAQPEDCKAQGFRQILAERLHVAV